MAQLIIARYDEDLSWLKEVEKHQIFIYNKGEANIVQNFSRGEIIKTSNIGREGLTWIDAILNMHNKTHPKNLLYETVFLQGNPFYHCHDVINRIHNLYMDYSNHEVIPFGSMHISNGNGCPNHCGLRVGEVYKEIFGEEKDYFEFAAGAQYCVKTFTHVLNKSVHFWERVKRIYLKYEESPWIFERLWMDIFNYNEPENEESNS